MVKINKPHNKLFTKLAYSDVLYEYTYLTQHCGSSPKQHSSHTSTGHSSHTLLSEATPNERAVAVSNNPLRLDGQRKVAVVGGLSSLSSSDSAIQSTVSWSLSGE